MAPSLATMQAEGNSPYEEAPQPLPLSLDQHPGQPATASDPKPMSLRRERSTKFREFSLYASRVRLVGSDSKLDAASIVPDVPEIPRHPQILTLPEDDGYLSAAEDNFSSSIPHLPAPKPISPLSPLTPRWDSLANSSTILYDRPPSPPSTLTGIEDVRNAFTPTPTNLSDYNPPSSGEDSPRPRDGSVSSETRDEFPPLPVTQKLANADTRPSNTADAMLVENFSRPRKASIKQSPAFYDSPRYRPVNGAFGAEPGSPDLPWSRERAHSLSSNKSAATLASLPVRPPIDPPTLRSRGRQATAPLSRPPRAYSRTDSNGPSSSRERLPRMASVPDELRASFRSQLSASTTPGTLATERSSVMTKSSTTSYYGNVDDGLSVEDVMGMYEKGFHDSDAPDDEDFESRPATGKSDFDKTRAAMLEAMSDPLPMPTLPVLLPPTDVIVRDSAAIFRNPELGSTASLPENIGGNLDYGTKHDSAKAIDDDDSDHDDDDDKDDALPPSAQLATDPSANDALNSDRDRYGFRKENQYVNRKQFDAWDIGYTDYLARRRRKWVAFLKESGLMTENPNRFPPRSTKTKRFVRKGIPPDWRGAAWFYYAGGPAILAKHPGVYDQLLEQKTTEVDAEAIERDLHRTFPDNYKFRSAKPATEPTSVPEDEDKETRNSSQTLKSPHSDTFPGESPMISSLRRVLRAFSIYNPRIGYCQSLNFLAGMLLLFVESEEHAFWLLNIITRVYLPGTHETSLEGANVDLGVLMSSLQDALPAVWAKIGGELDGTEATTNKPKGLRNPLRRNASGETTTRLPPITLCMTAWFMSCFIGTLPVESTLRVWDVFFYEGSKTLFRIALTIFKIGEAEIKAVGDPMEIFQVVQTIPRRLIDANGLMEACFKRRNGFGHIGQDAIEQKRQERRDHVKVERQRTMDSTKDDGTHGTVDDSRVEVKRKGTLFGRRKDKDRRPAEVM